VFALILGSCVSGIAQRAAAVGHMRHGRLLPTADWAAPARIIAPGRNQPDPFVLTTRRGYYLYSSQLGLNTPPVSVSASKNLHKWGLPRAAMPRDPTWATNGFTWAPDVAFIEHRYVMYFDAMAKTFLYDAPWLPGFQGRAQCIGTAVSKTPGGPFVPELRPLVCQFAHHGDIDPRTFSGVATGLWLDWKSDDNAVLSSTTPTVIYARRLSANGLTLVGPLSVLLTADESWQDHDHIIESPDMVVEQGLYWLFYSGGWFNEPTYGIGVARCAGPSGPCADVSTKPWLGSNSQGLGPGEESVFVDHHAQTWMVYSPRYYGFFGMTDRPVALLRVAFGPLGPYLAR